MRSLSNQEKALLFAELSRLEQSGIPRFQALSLIGETSSELSKRAAETLRLCQLNVSFPVSAFKAGLINDTEKTLFQLAETSAQYEKLFHHLESLYQLRTIRQKKLKSQLLLPAVVLILGLFIAPIPALFSNEITGLEYLSSILFTIIKLAILIWLFLRLPHWIKGNLLGDAIRSAYFRLQLNLPIFSRLYIQQVMLDYFRQLSLALSAGVPIIKSLELSGRNIENVHIRQQLAQLPQCIEQGDSFSEAIKKTMEDSSGVVAPELYQAVLAGEFSGKLDDSIEKMVEFLEIFNQQTLEAFFQWLPRIIYFLVLIILAYGLIR